MQRLVTSTTAIMAAMLRIKNILAFNFKGFLSCSRWWKSTCRDLKQVNIMFKSVFWQSCCCHCSVTLQGNSVCYVDQASETRFISLREDFHAVVVKPKSCFFMWCSFSHGQYNTLSCLVSYVPINVVMCQHVNMDSKLFRFQTVPKNWLQWMTILHI